MGLAAAAYLIPAEFVSHEEREKLIIEHLPQVRLIARKIHERLPDTIALDDLLSAGVIGLISAIDNFDPAPERQAEDLRRVPHPRRHPGQPERNRLGSANETPAGA